AMRGRRAGAPPRPRRAMGPRRASSSRRSRSPARDASSCTAFETYWWMIMTLPPHDDCRGHCGRLGSYLERARRLLRGYIGITAGPTVLRALAPDADSERRFELRKPGERSRSQDSLA